MEKNQVKRKERKSHRLNLKITDEESKFLRKENLSPQKIFDLAVQELKEEK